MRVFQPSSTGLLLLPASQLKGSEGFALHYIAAARTENMSCCNGSCTASAAALNLHCCSLIFPLSGGSMSRCPCLLHNCLVKGGGRKPKICVLQS